MADGSAAPFPTRPEPVATHTADVSDSRVPSTVPDMAEANNAILKELIVEATGLIDSSKGVLSRPERRRADELSLDILALIASFGEKVRNTDIDAVETYAATRK